MKQCHKEQAKRIILTTDKIWTAPCKEKFTVSKKKKKNKRDEKKKIKRKRLSARCTTDMELTTLIYKQLFKINTKNANNSVEKLQRLWTTNSQIRELKNKCKLSE